MTSQSRSSSPFSSSADKLSKAAATLTPLGTSSAACCADEPCQTPKVREARPPTPAARATVASTKILPARIAGLSCFSSVACPSNGTVSTRRSAPPHAAEFSIPETFAWLPTFFLIWSAASLARSASRDPMRIFSPARAHRSPRPIPAGPVPPRIAIGRGSGKLRLQSFLRYQLLQRRLQLDLRINRIPLRGDAPHFQNQRLELFRARVLPRSSARFARNVFFHQRSAVVVRPSVQAKL